MIFNACGNFYVSKQHCTLTEFC